MRKSSVKTAIVALSLGSFTSPAWADGHATPTSKETSAFAGEADANIAAVQTHIDAYRSGDLDQFVATFTKDAVVRVDGFVAIGHEQIKALYALNFEPDAPILRVYDSGVDGELVRVSIGYVFADGQEICCSASEYEVTNGKVSFLRTG